MCPNTFKELFVAKRGDTLDFYQLVGLQAEAMGSRLPVSHLKHSVPRRAGLVVLGGVLLGLWSLPALAAPPKPKNAKARKHFDRAVELFEAEDYDGAAREAEAGYAIEKHEWVLYIWAQAERKRHNCIESVELYNEFIEMTDNENAKENALKAKALCAEELAELARKAEEEAAAAEEEAEDEPDPEPVVTSPSPPRPWYRDPVGGVLVGVGGAGVLAGTSLLIAAAILDPTKASDYGTFDERRALQPRLLIAGGITAGVGVAIGAAGAVRWVLVARKNKQRAQAGGQARLGAAPWIDGRRAGVVLSGRF